MAASQKESSLKLVTSSQEPFDPCIRRFIMSQFPMRVCVDKCDLVDMLTNEILATKQVRLGPKPSPETQVEIRKVLRHYMEQDQPIPFMVPWGSEKPDGSGIDVAELGALKTLLALQERVKAHYTPGVRFNIRVEDASAPHLFHEDAVLAWHNADKYSTALENLIKALQLDNFIKAARESHKVTWEYFSSVADEILPYMHAYLTAIELGGAGGKSLEALQKLGWSGPISPELRDYYYSSYEKLYPGSSMSYKIEKLSRYFAGALARVRLKIRGEEESWDGKFIDLSFVQNPPGTDSRFSRRVLYRTLPGEFTSNHIPPWRAKGYLAIDEEGNATPKLASYNDLSRLQLNTRVIKLEREDIEVNLQADYVLV